MSTSGVLKRTVSTRTALSGHIRPLEPKKHHTKDIFSIPYTRCVYQHGEFENVSVPKLLPQLTDSDIGRVIDIECIAQYCFLVFSESGKVYTFGRDKLGGLGHGPDVKRVDHPRVIQALDFLQVSKIVSGFGQGAVVTETGKLYMWGNGTFSPTLTELPNSSLRVVQVALGSSHVAVRMQSGDLYTWGSNLVGQLGLGTTVDSVAQPCKVPNLPPLVDVKASYLHSLALTTNKELYLWGRNILAMPDESVPILYLAEPEHIRAPFKVPFAGSGHIAQIACGHEFNVVLTEEGEVWTWGRAKCGCLGNGSEEDHRSMPMIVKALEGVKIDNISCGIRHTAAWNASGAIYTWGWGEKGNLGHGDTENQLVPKLLQGLPFTNTNTPSDGLKTVMCSLSQTFIIWERYSPVEQALRYLEVNSLDQEGLFHRNSSPQEIQEIGEIQSRIDSGKFVDFPPKSSHLVATFLLRLLKASSPLLPHSIIQLMTDLNGVIDKPMCNLRVVTAICEAIDTSSTRTRGIIAHFSRFLIELSLHHAAKTSLPTLVILIARCFFTNTAVNQGSEAAQKQTIAIQECVNLLLQNAPVFFDYMFSGLFQLCNFVDFMDAPKLMEALSLYDFSEAARAKVTSFVEHSWVSFEPGSIFGFNNNDDIRNGADENFVVPFMSGIAVAQRRSMTVNVLERLDLISGVLRTGITQSEKANSAISALQQCLHGIEVLLEEIARPPMQSQDSPRSNIALSEAALVGLLEASVIESEPATLKPVHHLVYIGSGGAEDIALRRHGEDLEIAKDRLKRELLQVMRDLQSTSTQVAAQQRKRNEEAAVYLRALRQHAQDTRALYLLKGSEIVGGLLEQFILPPFYMTGDQAPPMRAHSVLSEVFVSVLEYVQYEWQTTVTALHSTHTNETWGRVSEVYNWWKSLCILYNWIDGLIGQLSSGIEVCSDYISPFAVEKYEISLKHMRHIFEETARYIKTTQHPDKTGDYLYEILEQKSSKT